MARAPAAQLDPNEAAKLLERRSPVAREPLRASVVVPTYGSTDWLRVSLLALRAHTPPGACETVVVDDGSANPWDIEQIVARHPEVELVRHEKNLGFAASVNRGARRTRAPVLVILNDDAVVLPGWLDGLLAALAGDPKAALVGPVSNDTGDIATIEARYDSLDQLIAFSDAQSGEPRPVDKLSLFCAAVRRSAFDEVGGLDESYGRGLFEDDDLCMALRARGHRALLVPSVFVHHAAGTSFRRLSPFEYHARFEVNRNRFERRWGVRWRSAR
jgi:GT2 family glycosyltransferase